MTESESTVQPPTNVPRKWWVAALWASISPPTALFYSGNPGWAVGGYVGIIVWLVFCLVAGFTARLFGVLVVVALGLIYSTVPVLSALARRRSYLPNRRNRKEWYVGSLIIWLLMLVFIDLTTDRIIGVRAYLVPTGSMENTLLPGDYILADTRAYDRVKPRRGDLVIHYSPRDQNTILVKRVAALPGDSIQIKYKLLYVNGQLIHPPRTATYQDPKRIFPAEMSPRDNLGPLAVEPNEYFVLGDNRDNSDDSRFWGNVPRELILGQAMLICFSREGLIARLERIGRRLDDYAH